MADSTRRLLPAEAAQVVADAHAATGLTLRQAARRIGIGHSHLWRLLHGQHAPSTRVVERLISVYGIDGDSAARLREAAVPREESGLTFREAARLIGISAGFLCEITQGRAAPSTTVAERIVRVLRLDNGLAEALREAAVERLPSIHT